MSIAYFILRVIFNVFNQIINDKFAKKKLMKSMCGGYYSIYGNTIPPPIPPSSTSSPPPTGASAESK